MKLLSYDDLRAKGILFSKTHIWRLMKDGKFPRAKKIGERRRAWSEPEVDDWIAGRPTNGGSDGH